MKCELCDKKHDGSYGSGRFCSTLCSHKSSTMGDNKEELKDGNCSTCGIPIRINKRASFSSVKCDDCLLRKRRKKHKKLEYCLNCNAKIVKKGSTMYCSVSCYFDYKYNQKIKKWKTTNWNPVKSGGSVPSFIKKYYMNKHNNKCSKCDWGEMNTRTNRIPLAVHHVDGNWKNNRPENLELLCPNCHSLTHNYCSLNIGNGRKK